LGYLYIKLESLKSSTEQALTVLAYVQTHTATAQETRTRTGKLLAELRETTPAETVEAAMKSGVEMAHWATDASLQTVTALLLPAAYLAFEPTSEF
jgi:hypothetical protein